MIAIGAGGIDVAVAMGGGLFYLTSPRVVKVNLTGALQNGVSAKDVILKILELFGTKGNVGCVMEYGGDGVSTLSVPSRATITNMGAELGVTTSVFPSDSVTRQFLNAQGRGELWEPLEADPDAAYDRVVDINLSELVPRAACPHSPGNIKTVEELAGMPVNQVVIGSCTNSSYRDLKTAVLMLKGRKVHPDVSVGFAPGSRQVVSMLAAEGLLGELVASGVRLLENACGFCIGNHFSPGSGGVSLRTSNRNFEGRSGTKDARLYLVSPETAAASALTAVFTDPATLDFAIPVVQEPEAYIVDDSMFLFRETAGAGVPDTEIQRGPNIGTVPVGTPLEQSLKGKATLKVGDKITTDHIMPAGARLKYRSNVPLYSTFVFENTDPEFALNATANRDAGIANVIIAGESYGQGSSREHAALCPMYLGVKAVIAKSIERIHNANLLNFGIVPFIFTDPADYDSIEQGDELEIASLREAIEGDGIAAVSNITRNKTFSVRVDLSDRARGMLLAGGLLASVSAKAT